MPSVRYLLISRSTSTCLCIACRVDHRRGEPAVLRQLDERLDDRRVRRRRARRRAA